MPRRIAGVSTDVVSKRPSFPTFGEEERDTLVPGIKIESDFKEEGTLGCFARLKSDNSIVLLSNHHILYGFSNEALDVGQPSPSCCWWCKCKVIAKNVGDGRNSFNRVTVEIVDDEGAATFHGGETDCSIARLNGKRPFSNEIPFIGMIAGTPPPGDFGVVVGSEVEKVGVGTDIQRALSSNRQRHLRNTRAARLSPISCSHIQAAKTRASEFLNPLTSCSLCHNPASRDLLMAETRVR